MTPFNVLNFKELTDRTKTRTRSLRGKRANTPDVHVHNYFHETAHQSLSHLNAVMPWPNVSFPPSHLKHKCYGTPRSSDNESDLEPIDIADMLQTLHNSMPFFNVPQYQKSLLSKGICYCQSVIDFN